MKSLKTISFSFLLIALGCSTPESSNTDDLSTEQLEEKGDPSEILNKAFESILTDAEVEGAILIYDAQNKTYQSNDFAWCRQGHLPASTFKITNSLIGLEAGVISVDTTLFKWNGEPQRLKAWEADLDLKGAFHASCVPCYQIVARRIGANLMSHQLKELNYGNMDVNSENIEVFWLEGESKITAFEQIDFLSRLYNQELPISKSTNETMKELIVIDETENYKLSGKTGWSIRNGNNNGWFVGYIENSKGVYYFAANIEPKEEFNMNLFPKIRREIIGKALLKMGIVD